MCWNGWAMLAAPPDPPSWSSSQFSCRKIWSWANRSLTAKCGLYYTLAWLLTTDWTSHSWWSTVSLPLTLKTTGELKQPYQGIHKIADEMLKHRAAQSAAAEWSSLNWVLVVWLRCLGITGGCTLQNERKRTSNFFLSCSCLWICCPSKCYD